jgi:hypothetical protein
MKLILWFVLSMVLSCVTYATFTTRDGVVLLNCVPKLDPEVKSQCESINTENQMKRTESALQNN